MPTILEIKSKYRNQIDQLDIDLIMAHILKRSREYLLTHPEMELTKNRSAKIEQLIERRKKHEPIAYLVGHKEFYGLDFIVNSATLIPRPETELLVEKTLQLLEDNTGEKISVIDVGTGSGNIVTSIAKNAKGGRINYFGIDISEEALETAKYNAKKNGQTKIKFLRGNLLEPLFGNLPADKQDRKLEIENSKMIILANLPYLSNKIYRATAADVRCYEPKSALYSPKAGLEHYEKLLKQLKRITIHCSLSAIHCFLEFSPEQKSALEIMVKKILPQSECVFMKDLAGKWRVCQIKLIS